MNGTDLKAKPDFSGRKIVIIGDLVADQFLHGTIARVSREAPVFILRHDETDTRGGAAANAAVNVASLGGTPMLVGLLGEDDNGRILKRTLVDAGVDPEFIISDAALRTTTKVRVLAGQQYAARQQVIRIDYENSAAIESETRAKLLENFRAAAADADAVVISDYGYGTAAADIFAAALDIGRSRSIPILIDSRFRLMDFGGATTATPNQDEVEQIIGADLSNEKCEELLGRLGFDSLLITRGNEGMLLLEKNQRPLSIGAIGSLEPVDVTGAGDTVIAAYALGLASGFRFADAARIANHAGGIVVMKKGTSSVTALELEASIQKEIVGTENGPAAESS